MGVSYLVVNVARRQYLDPSAFGEVPGWRYVPGGLHGIALSLLVCGPRQHPPSLLGSWYGDTVDRVGDSAPPDSHGVRTETPENLGRNLYAMAWREFEDISVPAISLLLNLRDAMAEALAAQVASNPYEGESLLKNLGDLLVRGDLDDSEALHEALVRHIGADWESRYHALAAGRR